jgi:hypothetical protein
MSFASLISGLLLVLVGPGCTLFGIWLCHLEIRCKGWSRIKGTIIRSETKRHLFRYGQYTCVPTIEFEFKHENQVVRVQQELFSMGDLESSCRVLEKYKQGEEITIFYDPRKPAGARVESNTNPLGHFLATIGLVFTFLEAMALRSAHFSHW